MILGKYVIIKELKHILMFLEFELAAAIN